MLINLKVIFCVSLHHSPLCLPLSWHNAGLGPTNTLAASPAASWGRWLKPGTGSRGHSDLNSREIWHWEGISKAHTKTVSTLETCSNTHQTLFAILLDVVWWMDLKWGTYKHYVKDIIQQVMDWTRFVIMPKQINHFSFVLLFCIYCS